MAPVIQKVCQFLALSLGAFVLSSCGSSSSQTLVKRGEALYQANCQSCHGGATGGSIRDIPPPHNANGHTWHHPDQQLTEIILNGFAFSLSEQKMPAFKGKLTEEEVKAILTYIKTWWTPEQREWQRKVTQQWEEALRREQR